MHAWSSEMAVWVREPSLLAPASDVLRREVERVDRLANRFDPGSEISRVNARAGERVAVSDGFAELLAVAVGAAAATAGAVDPTVGGALCRLGYDRDFPAVVAATRTPVPSRPSEPRPSEPRPSDPPRVAGWTSVDFDRAARTVRVPAGTLLDFGATAKALAADRVAAGVASVLGCGAVVSLGGDVAVAGDPPEGGFAVGIADTCMPGACHAGSQHRTTVAIFSGAVATSGIRARRWRRDGRWVHHIIDPATGWSAAPRWRTVSVAAGSCVDANAASTAAIVKGGDAPQWLESLGLPARLVDIDGDVTRIGGWPEDPVR